MARYVLFIPIGPIGSTGPIGAICQNELMPIGPIGSIGPIGAKCPIDANWANWFHGPNWCERSRRNSAHWANWFHRPNWRDMSYLCQLGQLVPRAQLVRYVLFMPIGPIGSNGPIGAICPIELMPIGPIGSIGPIRPKADSNTPPPYPPPCWLNQPKADKQHPPPHWLKQPKPDSTLPPPIPSAG